MSRALPAYLVSAIEHRPETCFDFIAVPPDIEDADSGSHAESNTHNMKQQSTLYYCSTGAKLAWKEQAANLKQWSKRVHEAVQVLNTKGHVDDCIKTRGVKATKVADVGPHIARSDSQGFDLTASAVVQQNNCQGIQVHLQQRRRVNSQVESAEGAWACVQGSFGRWQRRRRGIAVRSVVAKVYLSAVQHVWYEYVLVP